MFEKFRDVSLEQWRFEGDRAHYVSAPPNGVECDVEEDGRDAGPRQSDLS